MWCFFSLVFSSFNLSHSLAVLFANRTIEKMVFSAHFMYVYSVFFCFFFFFQSFALYFFVRVKCKRFVMDLHGFKERVGHILTPNTSSRSSSNTTMIATNFIIKPTIKNRKFFYHCILYLMFNVHPPDFVLFLIPSTYTHTHIYVCMSVLPAELLSDAPLMPNYPTPSGIAECTMTILILKLIQ